MAEYRKGPYRPTNRTRATPPPNEEETNEEAEVAVDEEALAYEPEQRVAITLSVGDGFKFGCGLLLAAAAFYFALIMVVAAALLVAMIFGIPLPFGGGR